MIELKLINTIEINPYEFSNTEYDSPNGSSKEMPEAWDKFWRKCLSDKNLENLQPIRIGSYLVDINLITNAELKEILKSELKEVDLENYEEQVGRICGGIVVKINNEFPIEPTCCGDIGNISEWERIFKEENHEWEQLWIGHPWVFYRKDKDNIEFSDYYDTDIKELETVNSLIKRNYSELKLR